MPETTVFQLGFRESGFNEFPPEALSRCTSSILLEKNRHAGKKTAKISEKFIWPIYLPITIFFLIMAVQSPKKIPENFFVGFWQHLKAYASETNSKKTLNKYRGPQTKKSPLNIGLPPIFRKRSYSNHRFSGAFAVSFREGNVVGKR